MNTSPLHFGSLRRPRAGALAFALLLSLVTECRALTVYAVSIDTSALAGQNGTLAFDLLGGDAAVANNTATVGSLATNGTLSDSAGFALVDAGFFNEVLRDITFGTTLSFTLQLTENNTPPGLDQFSFFLLDSATLLPLGSTTDPTGADALFAIDIDGQVGGGASIFGSTRKGIEWEVTLQQPAGVPDGGPAFTLMLVLWVGLLFVRGARGRKRAAEFSA
jgi:hypothetical protein